MCPLSLEEMQVLLRFEIVLRRIYLELRSLEQSLDCSEVMDPEDPSDVPIFFDKQDYRDLMCFRGPDYRKPFKFNNYSEVPRIENLSNPYYREFKHMKKIGFMKPHETYIGHYSHIPLFMRASLRPTHMKVVTHLFCAYDKNWGQFKKSTTVREAMALTKELFSPLNKKCRVMDIGFMFKHRIATNSDLCMSPGLPFCTDPFMQAQVDCLDRAFALAEEIAESAQVQKPSEVQVPPCMISGMYRPVASILESDFVYPMAVSIMERRFTESVASELKRSGNAVKTPLNIGLRPMGLEKRHMENLTSGNKYGCSLYFKNLESCVHPDLIDFAFSIIQQWFNMESEHCTAQENIKTFHFLKYYYHYTPLLLPSGQLIQKQGGAIAGSFFSRFVLSITGSFVLIHCLLKQGVSKDSIKGNFYCIKGAAAFSAPASFSTKQLVKDAKSLGFDINEESIRFSKNSSDLFLLGVSSNISEPSTIFPLHKMMSPPFAD